jgi:hypothetical protein
MTLTNYPTNRVHGQGSKPVYYFKISFSSAPIGWWHVSTLMWRPSLDGMRPPPSCLQRLLFYPPAWSSLIDLRCPSFPAKQDRSSFLTCESVIDPEARLVGSLEVALTWRRRLAPNSSPSKARFNPNEPNLRSLASSVSKESPPRVGVEASSVLVVIGKKVCVW